MTAELLTIGDELLIGQVVNTNAAWIGEQLSLHGVELTRSVTVGDGEAAIRAALAAAWQGADAVILTGGLGPTHDDITVEAVARYFEQPLDLHEPTLQRIRDRFARRGLYMPDSNRSQAMVPRGFEVLTNHEGSAPGLWFEKADAGRRRCLAILPGVPHEMKRLMIEEVLPRLLQGGDRAIIRHRTLLTAGIGESNLQDEIGDVSDLLGEGLRLAYLPGTSGVRLRITAMGTDADTVEARLARLEARLRERAGAHIYGADADTLEAHVGDLLRARGWTIAVAESCTGGGVADRLTNVPGSSAYMLGGIVAYCNSVKVDLLGVEEASLDADGAVSGTVARQMAEGVRARLGADVGIATTGVAGPGGGTEEKPVGTVWIAVADPGGSEVRHHRFHKNRTTNKELTGTYLLTLLRQRLHAAEVPAG